jgi:hypothetical protein
MPPPAFVISAAIPSPYLFETHVKILPANSITEADWAGLQSWSRLDGVERDEEKCARFSARIPLQPFEIITI